MVWNKALPLLPSSVLPVVSKASRKFVPLDEVLVQLMLLPDKVQLS